MVVRFSWWSVLACGVMLVCGLISAEDRPYLACLAMFIAGMCLYDIKDGIVWHLFRGFWLTDRDYAIAYLERQLGPPLAPSKTESSVIVISCACSKDCPAGHVSE